MKPRKVIQALILFLVFFTSLLVLGSSSGNSEAENKPGQESLNDDELQVKEGKMIWEGLSGQFFSTF